jgi:hypothetical protein
MITALIVSAAYIAAQMVAGMSIDAGTFIYPLTFTLRDLVHKVAGIKAARALIIIAAVINLVMAGFFWFVARLPADPQVGPQLEFSQVLSPVWRIVFASIVAEVIAELIDTEAYRFWVEKITRRHQWARVLVSNSLSVPLDSLVFAWLAFGGVFPTVVVWSIVLSNIIVKGITTILSIPGIYLVNESGVKPAE